MNLKEIHEILTNSDNDHLILEHDNGFTVATFDNLEFELDEEDELIDIFMPSQDIRRFRDSIVEVVNNVLTENGVEDAKVSRKFLLIRL